MFSVFLKWADFCRSSYVVVLPTVETMDAGPFFLPHVCPTYDLIITSRVRISSGSPQAMSGSCVAFGLRPRKHSSCEGFSQSQE